MKLTMTHNREPSDPKLHLTIDPQARTVISGGLSLPYLGALGLVLRRTEAVEPHDSPPTPPATTA